MNDPNTGKTGMSRATEEAFRRMTIGDAAAIARLGQRPHEEPDAAERPPLPATVIAMIRVASLVALDAPYATYRNEVAAALKAGLDLDDLLAVLLAVADQTGSARVVAAAPLIATAAGYDIEAELDGPSLPGATA